MKSDTDYDVPSRGVLHAMAAAIERHHKLHTLRDRAVKAWPHFLEAAVDLRASDPCAS